MPLSLCFGNIFRLSLVFLPASWYNRRAMEEAFFYNYDGLYRFALRNDGLILEHAAAERGQWTAERFSYDEIRGEFFTDIHLMKNGRLQIVFALMPESAGFFGQDEADEQIYPLTEELSATLANSPLPLKGAERLMRGTPEGRKPEAEKKTIERPGAYALTLAVVFAVCAVAAVLLFRLAGTTAGSICAAVGTLCFLFCTVRLFPVKHRYLFYADCFLLEEKTLLYCDRLLVYYEDVLNFTETDGELLIETELQYLAAEKDPWLYDGFKKRFSLQYNPYGKTLDEIRGIS